MKRVKAKAKAFSNQGIHCGARMITDTWAQRLDTGEQGLTSIAYETQVVQ